VSRRAAGFLFN